MSRELTNELARVKIELAKVKKDLCRAKEALVWCGGSSDFAPGGKAHAGWKKGVQAVLGTI